MADLTKEGLGPVTEWYAKTQAGLDLLRRACQGTELDIDGSALVPSRRNCEIDHEAREAGLTVEDIT